jgi:hypothetical protein
MRVAIPINLLALFFACSSCSKEEAVITVPINSPVEINQAVPPPLLACDDTSAFKSPVDLETLSVVQDCYLCNATKQVPGLGSIAWNANSNVHIANNKLRVNLYTYRPWYQYMLQREGLSIYNVPLTIGIHSVSDIYHFQADNSILFSSYGRSISDGDVSDGYWTLDTLCTNFIEITQLDLEDMEVRGNFEVHFTLKEQGQVGLLYSERVNFLNGKIEARILGF